MISHSEIGKIINTLKIEMGVSTFQEIIDKNQASRMRVGRKLIEKGNIGVRYEKNTIYVLREKMTSTDKCIFAIATQLCRRWVVPKYDTTDTLLEKIIDSDYTTLKMYNERFRKTLYGLIRTTWLLFNSTIPESYKEAYCRFGKKLYNPTNLEGVDNGKGRKLINGWEMSFRLQNLLIEEYLNEPTSDSSVKCLCEDDKSIVVKLYGIIKGMAKSFWTGYKDLLSEFDSIYNRFERDGNNQDKKLTDIQKKPRNIITRLDAEVFYRRCKSKGLSDKVIQDYFSKVQKLNNVEIVGVSENNKHLQTLVGEKMKQMVV